MTSTAAYAGTAAATRIHSGTPHLGDSRIRPAMQAAASTNEPIMRMMRPSLSLCSMPPSRYLARLWVFLMTAQ